MQPDLSTSTSDVVNTARQALCTAFVSQLEIAEKELAELREMLVPEFKGLKDGGYWESQQFNRQSARSGLGEVGCPDVDDISCRRQFIINAE